MTSPRDLGQRLQALHHPYRKALDHALTERALAAQGPPNNQETGMPKGGNTSSTTERTALEIHRWNLIIDNLTDALEGDRIATTHLSTTINVTLRQRAWSQPVDPDTDDDRPALCRDNLHGREGALEWADYTCTAYPTKAGLCERCYRREYRWRKDHQRPTRNEP